MSKLLEVRNVVPHWWLFGFSAAFKRLAGGNCSLLDTSSDCDKMSGMKTSAYAGAQLPRLYPLIMLLSQLTRKTL
jgi:hypothetical protein